MRGAKSAAWVAGAIAVALTATACGGGSSSKDSAGGAVDPDGVFSYQGVEPQNPLQPANANEVGGGRVLDNLFRGLTEFDPKTGALKMAAAEKIETKDSQHFTVTLKPGWTFHNGEPVTSSSFVDAWNWGANTKNAQINSSWFEDIKGYEDVHPASGDPKTDKMSGLQVKDDKTFTIELKQPVSYFQYKLGYVALSPLPKAFFKDPKGFGQKPVGNGPYQFVSWDHNVKITTKRFDNYKGDDKAKNGGVIFKVYPKPEAAYQDILSNNLDTLDQVDPTDLSKYKQDLGDRAIDQPMAGTVNIGFAMYDDAWKGVDKAKVRQGLSMAIDRKSIGEKVLQGSREPATGFVAPGTVGYQKNDSDVFKFNPDKAKQLIKEGGGVPGNKLTILYNSDGGHQGWVDAVCNSITQATGIACDGNPKPDFKTARDLITSKKLKAGEMYRTGWQADYPHNASFLADVFRTGAASNDSGYSSKEFDEMADKADKAKTPEESAKLYGEAEKILEKDMPQIPLWYYKSNAGYSTHVKNVTYDWIGQPVWTQVEVLKK
ncbi:peptide ABC transporter substrate-binding protein [Streptomyces varsoviensis]|uniref:Peptide ABC transporter substrate-binding protein n=1 Tax=Streptomyces varsoviensis TaxID=67373 RepID=A0ABR5JCD3_9ACTN|nr:ABC transporter substrate-binding protein [Streptomyces varsoviensis]KOG91064.1 peptide ABC transporter substrate-binding protein [Streptomyces varsoviensis]